MLGACLVPLLLNGGLRSAYAPEVAIPGALLAGGASAALVERFGFRFGQRLDGLGLASPIGGALLGGALGLTAVWILGTVAIEIDSLRSEVERSAILSRLDAVLAPPGPSLAPKVAYADPFPTFHGPSPAVGAFNRIVTGAPGVRQASRSVMRIEVLSCHHGLLGTGWIAADGVVVTNAHVVAGERFAAAQFRGLARAYPATPIWFDPKNDIALLRVPGARGMPALAIAPHPRAGTAAAAIGFPGGRWADRPAQLGRTSSMTVGVLSAREPMPREFSPQLFGRSITVFSGLVQPGNSGSPVVDGRGKVLTTAFAGGGETGFGVPNRFVRYALRHAGPPVGTGPCPPGSSP